MPIIKQHRYEYLCPNINRRSPDGRQCDLICPNTHGSAPTPGGTNRHGEFAAEPIKNVRVGFIGLGMRGPDAVKRFTHIPGTEVIALCDIEQDRVTKTQKYLADANMPKAAEYYGSEDAWKQLCDRDDIDLVYIATDWRTHAPMAKYAMEKGKHVAIEVPAATSLEEIWDLINTSERTRKHCMMLENCVYDFSRPIP